MDELRIPRENPNDDVVLITELYVSGEVSVNAGQELIEIETSKATIVLEAPRDGFLRVMVLKKEMRKMLMTSMLSTLMENIVIRQKKLRLLS